MITSECWPQQVRRVAAAQDCRRRSDGGEPSVELLVVASSDAQSAPCAALKPPAGEERAGHCGGMKGHTPRIRVLDSEQVAVAHPASRRAGHVRMRWCFDHRQQDSAAWASSLKAVHGHAAIIPDESRGSSLIPVCVLAINDGSAGRLGHLGERRSDPFSGGDSQITSHRLPAVIARWRHVDIAWASRAAACWRASGSAAA